LDKAAIENINWWQSHLSEWNGQGFLPQKTEVKRLHGRVRRLVFEDDDEDKAWRRRKMAKGGSFQS
jgi:hypothetical protein